MNEYVKIFCTWYYGIILATSSRVPEPVHVLVVSAIISMSVSIFLVLLQLCYCISQWRRHWVRSLVTMPLLFLQMNNKIWFWGLVWSNDRCFNEPQKMVSSLVVLFPSNILDLRCNNQKQMLNVYLLGFWKVSGLWLAKPQTSYWDRCGVKYDIISNERCPLWATENRINKRKDPHM